MRYAIISDLHGNLEALQAVERQARKQGAEAFWCLGDIVGYGADPAALVSWVRNSCDVVIAGNHDQAVSGRIDASYFNPAARAAAQWSASHLPSDHLAYLAALPMQMRRSAALLVHASPYQPERWHYLTNRRDAADNFSTCDATICFIGHTHIPGAFVCESGGGGARPEQGSRFSLQPGSRYIVNVGSVGQPRDGRPEASFVIYDDKEKSVEFRRAAYDVGEAARKIRAAKLPASLAERLAIGR